MQYQLACLKNNTRAVNNFIGRRISPRQISSMIDDLLNSPFQFQNPDAVFVQLDFIKAEGAE